MLISGFFIVRLLCMSVKKHVQNTILKYERVPPKVSLRDVKIDRNSVYVKQC